MGGLQVPAKIIVLDESVRVKVARQLNFVGDGVTVTAVGPVAVITVPGSPGGVTDHGALTGLEDNDHPQYELAANDAADAVAAVKAAVSLDDLLDVDTPTPNDGDLLTWDEASATWIAAPAAGGAMALNDLTDVDTAGVDDDFILYYHAGTGTWLVKADCPTAFASGTQTAVVTTEHFLSNVNVAGKFQLSVDTVNMAAGDVLELRIYDMVLTNGTPRVAYLMVFYGAQAVDDMIKLSPRIVNDLTDAQALRFSLKQTFGTGRDFPWKVVKS